MQISDSLSEASSNWLSNPGKDLVFCYSRLCGETNKVFILFITQKKEPKLVFPLGLFVILITLSVHWEML